MHVSIRKRLVLSSALLFISLSFSLPSTASLNETLPPYHWAYEYLNQLRIRGYFTHLYFLNKPFTRGQVAEALLKLEELPQPKKGSLEHDLIEKLKAEFQQELVMLQKQRFNQLGVGAILMQDFNRKGTESKFRGVYRTQLEFSPVKNLSIFNAINFDQYRWDDPNYMGKKWRGIVGFTEQAYTRFSLPITKHNSEKSSYFTFLLGRDFLKWGQGRSGNLLFSDYSRPLDQLSIRYSSGWFTYTFLAAQLDDTPLTDSLFVDDGHGRDAKRYLASHRLDLRIGNRFYFGVTETILYGGVGENVRFVYLNPFVFYHGSNLNHEGIGNTLGTIDCDIYPGKKWELYGELLIDDVQIEKTCPGDLEPNQIAFLLGWRKVAPFTINGLDVGMEYVQLRNRVYKTHDSWEWWVHRNRPLGYCLGSDLDNLQLDVNYWIKSNCLFRLQYNRIRQGEGRMSKPFDTPWMAYTVEQGYHEKFPTGVVEKTQKIKLQLIYHPHVAFRMSTSLIYQKVNNVDNMAGREDSEWSFQLGAWWTLEKILPMAQIGQKFEEGF